MNCKVQSPYFFYNSTNRIAIKIVTFQLSSFCKNIFFTLNPFSEFLKEDHKWFSNNWYQTVIFINSYDQVGVLTCCAVIGCFLSFTYSTRSWGSASDKATGCDLQQLRAKSVRQNKSDISIIGRGAGGTGCMKNCSSGVLQGQREM